MSTWYDDREYDRDYERGYDRYSRRPDYDYERGRYERESTYGVPYGEPSRRYSERAYSGRDYERDYGRVYDREYGRVYDRERDYGLGRGYGTPGYEREYDTRYGRGYDYARGRYGY